MTAAIDRGIQFAIGLSKSNNSVTYSIKYNQFFTFDQDKVDKVKRPKWGNYLSGIVCQLYLKGYKIKPFNCVFDGNLPVGAGLGSSAAIEYGFLFALNELFELNLSKLEMIHIASMANHAYPGLTKAVDGFASICSIENHAMVVDRQRLTYNYCPLNLDDHTLILCDAKLRHPLSSAKCNTVAVACAEGIGILKKINFNIDSLRDVPIAVLMENMNLFPDNVFRICKFLIDQNQRVLSAAKDLQARDLEI